MTGNGASDYDPQPRDTSGTVVPKDLLDMVELLAENAHDTWAKIRRAGSNGPHPGLVPYQALSNEEKQIDREMVLNTIRLILHLGYDIERRS